MTHQEISDRVERIYELAEHALLYRLDREELRIAIRDLRDDLWRDSLDEAPTQ